MKIILVIAMLLPVISFADQSVQTISIKDHKFEPALITIPAGQKVKLLIENKDNTPEEFDSHALNREKIIAGNASTVIYIGPLDAGQYPFVGEFNETTAHGAIKVE